MIGQLSTVVLDTPDPPALARFYSEVLGLPVTRSDDDWWTIGTVPGFRMSFQLAPDHQPPRWPDPDHPQQFHVDVMVDDIEAAERAVLALGAKLLHRDDDGFTVFADPSGHPFCLVDDYN